MVAVVLEAHCRLVAIGLICPLQLTIASLSFERRTVYLQPLKCKRLLFWSRRRRASTTRITSHTTTRGMRLDVSAGALAAVGLAHAQRRYACRDAVSHEELRAAGAYLLGPFRIRDFLVDAVR
ncbi:hypothetical protein PINS_up005251 [Pythium insidiosum]|nr:hypothetical protein PINS_up005251 [Pythium insidiosum]